ncbi:MAG: M28 family peptidase [Candidatus Kariarchaeaceae archaeon]|jgi:hypothetical protein
MKKLLQSIFLLILTLPNISHSQSPVIQSIIDQTNIDSLIFFVEELSGEGSTLIGGAPYTIMSRNQFQPGNDKAADYIEQKLEYYGLAVYNQQFSSSGKNIYGVQTGTEHPDKQYIICAHYDDVPNATIAPGADDNASGTAAVLEAARIFSQYVSDYTIIYALWDEEEQGLVGSNYYAQLAQSEGDSILGVINLDMIAWDSNDDGVGEIHVRPIANSIDLKSLMVDINSIYNIGLDLQTINPGSGRSDHASFWNMGYGAILLIENFYGGDFNAYYHSTNDLVTHFNQAYYLKMSKTANGTLATLVNVAGIVPVELISFSGYALANGVRLDWTTASELNNLGFEIERSIDGNEFETIGFVEGKGSSTVINQYSFTDYPIVLTSNVYYYRLKQFNYDGQYLYSQIIEVEVLGSFLLAQNYPNPFNPSTTISFSIPESGNIKLSIYNLIGEEVAILKEGFAEAGRYDVEFRVQSTAGGLPSGIYFYKLQLGNFIQVKKMSLMK